MEQIEQFFTNYEKTAMAFYTFAAFLGVLTAIAFRLHTLYKRHLERKIDEGKVAQRHEFQAGYFDLQEQRYDRLLDMYIVLNDKLKD